MISKAWHQNPKFRRQINTALMGITKKIAGKKQLLTIRQKEQLEELFLIRLRQIMVQDPSFDLTRTWLPNTKFCLSPPASYRGEDFKVVVLQEKPQVRSLWFSANFLKARTRFPHCKKYLNQIKSDSNKNLLPLALPYTIFTVFFSNNQYKDLYVYYSNKDLQSIHNRLFVCNLPNCSVDGDVCMGDFRRNKSALNEQAREAVDFFWQSMFTSAWSAYSIMEQKCHRLNVWNWTILTQTNPGFILEIPWQRSPVTINSLIRKKFEITVEGTPPYQIVQDSFLRAMSQVDFTAKMSVRKRVEEINYLFYSALKSGN